MINKKWFTDLRMVAADYHFWLGREWLNVGHPNHLHTPLVYAAFEFRSSIERVAFELLLLIKYGRLTKTDFEHTKGFGDLVGYIGQLEGRQPVLKKKLRFAQIICELSGQPFSPAIISISELRHQWEVCSGFCHKQLSPKNTWEDPQFAENGYNQIAEVNSFLDNILVKHRLVWIYQLQPEVQVLQQKFITRLITERQLVGQLKLAQPVLAQRRSLGS